MVSRRSGRSLGYGRRRRKAKSLKSYRPFLDRAVFAVALLGVLVAVHVIIQQGRGFEEGCFGFSDGGAAAGCGAVVQSEAGTLFGVSNGVWGFIFYAGIAALTLLAALTRQRMRAFFKSSRALLVTGGLGYSAYLSYVQYAVLEEWCVLCIISASLVGLLFLFILADMLTRPPITMQSLPAPREWMYLGVAVVLVGLLAGADVFYFNQLDEDAGEAFTVESEGDCYLDPSRSPVEDYGSLIEPYDATAGDDAAPVTVVEFLDPNCPHCADNHEVVSEVLEEHGQQVHYVYKPIVVVGQHSVIQVAALYLADEEGLFEEMLEEQFARQQEEGLSVEELQEIAEEIGMDTEDFEERLQSEQYLAWMQRERELALEEVGVTGVPTMLINGRYVPGEARTAECLGELIEDEALIGAAIGH